MSMVNQTPQRAPRLRVVVAGAVAVLLLGSSLYAARAGNNNGYNDSLNGGEIAAITLGGAGAIWAIADVMKKDKDSDDASNEKSKSAKSKAVKEVRVQSSRNQLGSGDAASVEVQARYEGSSSWTNVTDRASIQLAGNSSLTQIDGSKNAFAVPYGSQVVPGAATIQASFGGQTASATINVN